MYIYLQPNLVSSLLKLISYRRISGYFWILANVAYRYDTETHFLWLIRFCLPTLLIIGFIIPLFMFLCLRGIRNKLNDKKSR